MNYVLPFLLLILPSALWVLFDAQHRLRAIQAEAGDTVVGLDGPASTPFGWALFVLLFWLIGFPWYLTLRFRKPGPAGQWPAWLAIGLVPVALIALFVVQSQSTSSGNSSIPADVQVQLGQAISYSDGFQIALSDYTSNDTAVDGLGAPMGKGHFDAANIQATTTGSSALTLYLPGRLTVIGSDNQSYGVDNSGRQTTGCRSLSGYNTANVLPNQHLSLCVTFVLPDGVTAKRVEFTPAPGSTVAVWTL